MEPTGQKYWFGMLTYYSIHSVGQFILHCVFLDWRQECFQKTPIWCDTTALNVSVTVDFPV